MMPSDALYTDVKHHILAVVRRVLEQNALTDDDFAAVGVEAPREEAHGDLATNVAMVLAKKVGKAPRELADMLLDGLRQHPAVAEVSVAGPGFINLKLYTTALMAQAVGIPTLGKAYGMATLGQGHNALVEYVSINPTGPVHVGHGRNAVFGDAIANLLEKAGYPVTREYLVNDAGGQIRTLVKSLHARYLQLFGEDVAVPADGYPGEYLIDIAKDLQARDGDKWRAVTDEQALLDGLRAFAVDACMALIKADMVTMGIHFDAYFSEFEMHKTRPLDAAVAMLREKGLVYEGVLPPPKGKDVTDYEPVELTLFKATAFGLPDDKAIYNRAGIPTYFGQDIAYHWNKIQRGYDYLPVVIDFRQAGNFKPLGFAIEAMTGKKGISQPVPYELVNVLRNGVPVKLSKRAGNIVALKDVLDEIGTDAFRFAMLTVKPTTVMVFDLAKAVEKSMDNPVFYVQYAHARLCAVERQRVELGIPALPAGGDFVPDEGALSADARSVLREVMLYPALIEQAARALEPHRLTVYATGLAAAIHRWYGAERWLEADNVPATHTRLAIALAARTVLADALRVCGVNAPGSM